MTDSIPPSLLRGLPPLPPEQLEGDVVRLEEVTGELRVVARAIRIAGEVIRENRDGTLLIRTDKGDVTVRPRAEAELKAGDQVEIDIPAGRPPRQAVVREMPPLPPLQVPTQQPSRTQVPDPSNVLPPRLPPRPAPELIQQDYAPPDKASVPVPVRAGDIMRLVPLPPDLAEEIIPAPVFSGGAAVEVLPESAVFTARLLTEAVQDEQAQDVIKIFAKDVPVVAAETLPRVPVAVLYNQESMPAGAKRLPVEREIVGQFLLPFLSRIVAAAPDFLAPALLAAKETAAFSAPVFQPLKQAAAQPAAVQIISPPMAAAAAEGHIFIQTSLPKAAPADPQITPLFPATSLHNLPLILPVSVIGREAVAAFVVSGITSLITAPARADGASLPLGGHMAGKTTPEFISDVRIVTLTPPAVVLSGPDKTALQTFFPDFNPYLTTKISFPPVITKDIFTAGAEAAVEKKAPFILSGSALTLTAPVVGFMPATNHPVIAVPVPGQGAPALFSLPSSAPHLQQGASVEMVVLSGALPAVSVVPDTAVPAPLLTPPWQLFSSFDWPALDDIQHIIGPQGQVQTAQNAAHPILPNPATPARVTAAALFFIAAVRAGDMAGWLGDKAIDTLRRAGREDAIGRINRDFSGLQKSDADPVAQDWRAMSVPLSWQEEVHKMMIYYRRDGRDENGEESGKKDTRFIIEINPRRMGLVQLDGFHRHKKLDLIVRTQKPVGQGMKQAMRRLWIDALEQTSLSGEISFQSKPEQFVKIDIAADIPGVSA